MKQSLAKFRHLADWAPISIAMLDRDMRYLDLTKGWRDDCQIGDRNVIGLSHYDLFPDLPERWKEVHRRCIAGETERCESDRFLRADGTTAWIRWEVKPWHNDSGEIGGIVMWTEDITAQKLAEAEMRNSERRFKAALANSSIVVCEQDLELRYTWIYNPKLGYGVDEVLGKTDAQLMDPVYAQKLTTLKQRVIEAGQSIRQAVTVAAPGAGQAFFDLSVDPLRDASGQIVGISCTAIDITERQQASQALDAANQELARSNADLEQFAYAASHDLLEPLRSVSGSVQLLQRRYGGQLDATADNFIHHAVDGSKRMQAMIMDLLAYSRVRADGQDEQLVSMRQAFDLACGNLGEAIVQSAAHITCGELPTLKGNQGQLTQLFQNLLGNALKFHGKKTAVVDVQATKQVNGWLFSVKDQGIGIEAQYLERIFKIFQRLHTREEYPGTGIGLTLCKKIVERHGGAISIESIPGVGTTVFFTLPGPVDTAEG